MESITERLKKRLSGKGTKRPWAYGMKGELSKKAKGVWELLSEDEKLLMSRHCPSKKDRNQQIRALKDLGIICSVLSEMSGLSERSIAVIVNCKTEK